MMANKNQPHQRKLSSRDSVLTSLIAGAIAGAYAKTVIAPLDRTKINFQIRNIQFSFRDAYKFLVDSYRQDGILSLWRGNSATMARVVPYAAIQYASHEHFKKIMKIETNAQKKAHPERSFIAGSCAGVTATSVTYPLDLAKARMAVTHKEQYNSLIAVFMKTIREEGAFTLYRGFLPTILGVIPYAGTSFFTYETLKRLQSEVTHRSEPHPHERLIFGAIAGLFGQSASYPLDVVRRRMQTRSSPCYRTLLGTIKHVLQQEGLISGLYKGLSLNWVKGPIAVGISFTTFDITLKFIRELPLYSH